MEHHRHEIVDGSGMDPVLAHNQFFSVTADEAASLGFARCQARAGWVAELLSPVGEVFYVLKPDRPRTDDRGRKVKYEIRACREAMIDVGNLDDALRVLRPDEDGELEPLLVTEGAKKAWALRTLGKLTISLTGVWNWGVKREKGGVKYGRPELLGDWDEVPLEGREILLCFDADYREKPNVALALLRLAERLTKRGAHVFIACPPGPEKGIDDYLVAGRSLEELENSAVPFDPVDFTPYIASNKSAKVHKIVASQMTAMRFDDWTGRSDKSAHSLLRTHLELALERGRYSREDDAVRYIASRRELLERTAIGSHETVGKADAKLIERGYIEKESGDYLTGKSNSYRMKLSQGVTRIEEWGGDSPIVSTPVTVSDNFVTHLRWPAPVAIESKDGPKSKLPPPDAPPENRLEDRPDLPRVAVQDMPVVPEPRRMEGALGKVLEVALWCLCQWGGRATIRDLGDVVGVNHTAKMRGRLEDLEAAGVVGMDPKGKHYAEVWLTSNWEVRLRERKELAGDYERARSQAVRHHEARQVYHSEDRSTPEGDPTKANGFLLGPETMREVIERSRETEKQRWIEEQRTKVGTTAATWLADELEGVSGGHWPTLRDRYAEEAGGEKDDLRTAVTYGPWVFKPEKDGSLSVYWETMVNRPYDPNVNLWQEWQKNREDF